MLCCNSKRFISALKKKTDQIRTLKWIKAKELNKNDASKKLLELYSGQEKIRN